MRHTRIQRLAAAGLVLAGLAAAAPAAPAQETVVYTTREAGRGGWLGISFDWDEAAPEQMRITQVFPGSPASGAGVRQGDVVLRIGNRPATSAAMAEVRARLAPGDTLRLRVRGGGAERDVALVATGRPRPQLFAERVLRLRGDTIPGARVFRFDSTMARIELDSMVRLEHDGRNVMILRGDSLRALTDSLLFRVDTLRRSIRIRGGRDSVQVFAFPAPDSAAIRRMHEVLRMREGELLREGTVLREGTGFRETVPFFLEMGRRALAGAEMVPMNEGLARYFATREGLLVTRVSPSSPAGRAGLEAGDVVVRAGGRAITTVEELREAVRRAENGRLPLEVVRQRRRQTVELKWEGEAPGVPSRIRTLMRPTPRVGGTERR